MGDFYLQHMGSGSLTRDQTLDPYIGNLESGPPGESVLAPCCMASQQCCFPQAAQNAEAHLCPSLCSLSLLPSDLPDPSLLLGPYSNVTLVFLTTLAKTVPRVLTFLP